MTRDKFGIPNYANSTLLAMPKQDLLAYIRTIEHNWRSAEQTIEIQAENCKKLLAEERNKAVDDAMKKAAEAICIGCGYLDGHKCKYDGGNCSVSKPMLRVVIRALEQLKAGDLDG